MHFTAEQLLDGDIVERAFLLDDIPGLAWSPPSGPAALILMGLPGGLGLEAMYPRLVNRGRRAAAFGIASATLELPGSGSRPRIRELDQARLDLRQALSAGEPTHDILERLVTPVVAAAIPELQAAIDELLALEELNGKVGYSGGLTALGVRLAHADPRIRAVGLFAGSHIPESTFAEARQLTTPVHMLLQWDDEGNDRDRALALFDALSSREKTLQANLGGHHGVPDFASEDALRFFARHLG